MSYHWQTDLRSLRHGAASVTPPAPIGETAWDILLTLHSDRRCEIRLEKLARLVSAPNDVLNDKLAELEDGQLITGVRNEVTNEVRALLTAEARRLLDRYLSTTTGLQAGTDH